MNKLSLYQDNQFENTKQVSQTLIGLYLDDGQLTKLLGISRQHCKLTLEHSKRNTSIKRQREIVESIAILRIERQTLIEQGWKNNSVCNGLVRIE